MEFSSGELAESIRPITQPYALFVCPRIEIDEHGLRWTDAVWAKDLAFHLDYLSNLTLVSPGLKTKRISDKLVSLNEPPFDRLTFFDLTCPTSKLQALVTMPWLIAQYWRAVGRARIVHCGFAGWPIILGWVVVPFAKVRRKFVLTNVESSPWRASGTDLPWYRRLQGSLGERLTRFLIGTADLRLFTSTAYMQELTPAGDPKAYVIPATWLNDEWILSDQEAVDAWDAKTGPVRMLYASRLVREKGLSVLLSAISAAVESGVDVEFSIIGSGGLRDECIAAASSFARKSTLTVLDEVPYGDPFLSLLRGFDALLLPSISDEQPRIAYDALSQAVPVIGSATGGICEVVESGVSGRLSPPQDASALAESIIWASRNRSALREMGMRGLARVRQETHQAMHRNRYKLLRRVIDEYFPPSENGAKEMKRAPARGT